MGSVYCIDTRVSMCAYALINTCTHTQNQRKYLSFPTLHYYYFFYQFFYPFKGNGVARNVRRRTVSQVVNFPLNPRAQKPTLIKTPFFPSPPCKVI